MCAGLLPGLAQVIPSAAISFYVFERTKALLGVSWCRLLARHPHICTRD